MNILPANLPKERYYWLLGVCFSKVTYLKHRYARFTWDTDEKFVKQVASIFRIGPRLYMCIEESEKFGFHFPQRFRDYRSFFSNRGIIPGKEKRKFPEIPNNQIRHFIRGYFDAQSSIFKEERRRNPRISIHFSNRSFGKKFVNILFQNGIYKRERDIELDKLIELYKTRRRKSWETKLQGINIYKFYKLIYWHPYPITFRLRVKKDFDEMIGNLKIEEIDLKIKLINPKVNFI
ncbi:MAG: LAGLIDADG family homing endonuclease [Promethearchaeota archaeon]